MNHIIIPINLEQPTTISNARTTPSSLYRILKITFGAMTGLLALITCIQFSLTATMDNQNNGNNDGIQVDSSYSDITKHQRKPLVEWSATERDYIRAPCNEQRAKSSDPITFQPTPNGGGYVHNTPPDYQLCIRSNNATKSLSCNARALEDGINNEPDIGNYKCIQHPRTKKYYWYYPDKINYGEWGCKYNGLECKKPDDYDGEMQCFGGWTDSWCAKYNARIGQSCYESQECAGTSECSFHVYGFTGTCQTKSGTSKAIDAARNTQGALSGAALVLGSSN